MPADFRATGATEHFTTTQTMHASFASPNKSLFNSPDLNNRDSKFELDEMEERPATLSIKASKIETKPEQVESGSETPERSGSVEMHESRAMKLAAS